MDDRLDMVVVGGGIHGAGVAQAAAAAGCTVRVLEERSLAAGTSSRSSKLIHGGLRYLETGQVSVVRECLRERHLLLQLAPDLVQMRDFYLPVYRHSRRRAWQLQVGLSLYALLGNLRHESRYERVDRRRWRSLDGLNTDGLQAVFRYQDAQTDDAALTASVMRSAIDLGAEIVMPARFCGARVSPNGCVVTWLEDGCERTCVARVLVNAAGPWVAGVLRDIVPRPRVRAVELVQGTHILVRGALHRGVYLLESPQDGRAVFAMPWEGKTLVGTTETTFRGDPDDVRPLPEEEAYLSEVMCRHFPHHANNGAAAPLGSFAGLRVLPAGPGSPTARSRETLLDVDDERAPRVLTIYGGKLTAYRATAERVVERLRGSLPARRPVADTKRLTLTPP